VIGWKKNGVQDGVFRNLRLGKHALEATLDPHRKTVKSTRSRSICPAGPGEGMAQHPDQPRPGRTY
jgi:hypothetical protein